jgi:hypothetical protein
MDSGRATEKGAHRHVHSCSSLMFAEEPTASGTEQNERYSHNVPIGKLAITVLNGNGPSFKCRNHLLAQTRNISFISSCIYVM